jgi:octaprenyl-diphosphate synthase
MAQCLLMVGEDLAAAESELHRLLQSDIAVIPAVAEHLAFAGGKRFRPLLALLCARAAGLDDPSRITVAAVGELLHTATLLHDDVIDEGEFRRGRPAARLEYGNGLSVLTGDYCLARSLQAVAATGQLRAVQTMGDAVTRMAEGEVAQLHAAGDGCLDRHRYYQVIERKTAALIAWCSSVAGLVDESHFEPLHRFGLELGYAFQIADDLLDFRMPTPARTADADTGKDPGQDLREGKVTLPLLLACEADPSLHRRVDEALRAGPPMADHTVRSLVEAVRGCEAPGKAEEIALSHAGRAREALAELPPSEAREALDCVAYYVVRRSN